MLSNFLLWSSNPAAGPPPTGAGPLNNRLYFAITQAGFSADGGTTYTAAHGLRSVGVTTNFNLTQVFEIGQLAIYQLLEEIPDIEVTMEKQLDGKPLLYHLATQGAVDGSLPARGVVQTTFGMAVFAETQVSASGTPIAEVHMSNMVPSSLTYSAQVDGPATESLTLVGYNKVWVDVQGGGTAVFTGKFPTNADTPSGSIQRRENVVWLPLSGSPTGTDVNGQLKGWQTILPTEIPGIAPDGSNPAQTTGTASGFLTVPVQSISISADLGRDAIYELGRRSPYNRYITFPVEVRTDIEVIATKMDGISATEAGGQNGAPTGSNLKDQTIRLQLADGTRIDTGVSNKLQSVAWQGGDAASGGGNVTNRYTYVTYNNLNVYHPADPSALP